MLTGKKHNDTLFDLKANGSLSCHLCDKNSPTLREIISHFEREHSIEPATLAFLYIEAGAEPVGSNIDTDTQSSDCDKGFVCEICHANFTTYKGMKQHIGKKHQIANKIVKCPLCDNKFKHKYALKFHVKQVHESSTRVQCPECSKVLYNKYTLKKHLLNCRPSN